MAIGKSGVKIDLKKLSISFGGIKIIEKGQIFKNYKENEVANYMKESINRYFSKFKYGLKKFYCLHNGFNKKIY